MSFRLVPKSVTLNDLQRRNCRYFALFHRTRVLCRCKTISLLSKSTFYLFIYLFESGNMTHKKHENDRQRQKMIDENTNIKEHTKDTHTHRKQLK